MKAVVQDTVAATDAGSSGRGGAARPPAAARLVRLPLGPAVAVLLQVAALATFLWVNDLLGYNLVLLTLPAAALLHPTGLQSAKWARLSQRLAGASFVAIAVLVLALGAIHARGFSGSWSAAEGVLLAGAASDLLLAGVAIFGRRAGLSAESRTVLVCWALLSAVSRVLHYNLRYDAGVVSLNQGGAVDFERNFRSVGLVLSSANVALAAIVSAQTVAGSRPALAAFAGRVESVLRQHCGGVASAAVAAAVGATVWGLWLELVVGAKYPSWPLFAWFPALAAAAWAGAGMERRRVIAVWSILAPLAVAGPPVVDLGLSVVIILVTVLLAAYGLATGVGPARSRPIVNHIPSCTPALVAVVLVLGVPLVTALLAGWAAEPPPPADRSAAALILRRAFAVLHPGAADEFFVRHMYTAQLAMQEALEHGGVFGDGWWHNPVFLPQLNNDFILTALFRYHGLAGWGVLGLMAVFLAAVARLALRKAFDGDGVRAEALGGVALATFLVVALPGIWSLGAFALALPWTGIPLPFLSRGTYLHGALALMVAGVILLEGKTLPAAERVPPRGTRAGTAFRASMWTVALLGLVHAGLFAWNVQRPALRTAVARPRYILVPENAGEVVRLRPGVAPGASDYRVGNAVVKVAIHDRTDRHLDDFAYISGYVFNEAEGRRGISIGQGGRTSPVLRIPMGGAYVQKVHDVVLFWERMEGRLFLRPTSVGVEVVGVPATDVYVASTPDRDLRLGEVLPWGSTLRIGGTRLRLDRSASAREALRIELDPDAPARAYMLRRKQGPDFRLSPTGPTVIGGLRLSTSAIEPGRPLLGWIGHNRQYVRGTLRDRAGGELVRGTGGGAEYADPNLVLLIGTARAGALGRPFGLEYVFDPILSGVHRRGSLMDVTRRTLRREPLPGEDVFLTLDLATQRRLTAVVERFGASAGAASGSALILDARNRVLALADFDRWPDAALPADSGALGPLVRFDSAFWTWFAGRDFLRFDSELNQNPFMRRPLPGAFATDLTGSVFKGVIYASALADHFAGRRRWFTEARDVRDRLFLAMPGDSVNGVTVRGSRVLAADTALIPFGGVGFRPIRNYGRAVVPPVLGAAVARSGNIPPAYLSLGLHRVGALAPALSRFGLEQELLLRPEALQPYTPLLNDAAYVLAEPIRFADSFDWTNPSDVARLGGLGDKVYLSLLHVAVFYATVLLHEGDFVHPEIVSRIGEQAVRPIRFPVFDPDVSARTVAAMETLFQLPFLPGGTGAAFARGLPAGVRVRGGKTGTASVTVNDPAPHRVFVAVVEVGGEAYTIATRINRSRAGDNDAMVLARQIVLEVLR